MQILCTSVLQKIHSKELKIVSRDIRGSKMIHTSLGVYTESLCDLGYPLRSKCSFSI